MKLVVKKNNRNRFAIGMVVSILLAWSIIASVPCSSFKDTTPKPRTGKDVVCSYEVTSIAYLNCEDTIRMQSGKDVREYRYRGIRSLFADLYHNRSLFGIQVAWGEFYIVITYIYLSVGKVIWFIHDSDGKKGSKISRLFTIEVNIRKGVTYET